MAAGALYRSRLIPARDREAGAFAQGLVTPPRLATSADMRWIRSSSPWIESRLDVMTSRSQLQPPARPHELERTSKVNGHVPASVDSPAAPAPSPRIATDALDVGEQIRRLQALVELQAAGILTLGELTDLKRRVLLSGLDDGPEARHAAATPAPPMDELASAEAATPGGKVPPAEPLGTAKAATGASPVGARATKATADLARRSIAASRRGAT